MTLKSEKENFELKEVRVKLVPGVPLTSQTPMTSPETAVEVIGNYLSDMDREVFCIVNLDNKLKPINYSIVSIGTINQTIISPREVLKASILSNAMGIMLFHNHPSRELLPSKDDTRITDRLSRVCHDMGIELIDHIIVGPNKGEHFSYANKNILPTKNNNYKEKYQEIDFDISKVAEKERRR